MQKGYVLDHENAHWQVYSDYLRDNDVQARAEALVIYDILEMSQRERAIFILPAGALSEAIVHRDPALNQQITCKLRQ